MKDKAVINHYSEMTEKIRRYTLAAVSEHRYKHSVSTAETAVRMCRLYGLDEEKGYLAGISHDMCKEMNAALLMSIAGRDGKPFSQIEQSYPSVLHGRAAAVKLQEAFGINDPDIIEAVAVHTFGKKGMGPLAAVIYAADKIEPERDYVTEDYLDKMFMLDLPELVKTVLERNIEFLKKKRRSIALETQELLESLKQGSRNV